MEPPEYGDCVDASLCRERPWNRLLVTEGLVRTRFVVKAGVESYTVYARMEFVARTGGPWPLRVVKRLGSSSPLAGFHPSLIGRFWVSPEV